MNITEMLGLQDEWMKSFIKKHWATWVSNGVLLGLARLAAFDGADDREAALVLAWLLLPTALRLRRRQRTSPLDPTLEGRLERVRDHLRGSTLRRSPLLSKQQRATPKT